MAVRPIILSLLGVAFLASCGEPDIILEGERENVRFEDTAQGAQPISLPAARVNADWTHRNGSAAHRQVHPSLSGLTMAFATNIGEGDSRRARITADPIVAGGAVYTLDARARVTATSPAGATLWSVNLPTGLDGANDASGGGLAYAAGRLYVASGFGSLTALDARSGGTIWTQDLDAPGTSAPTVVGDLVYVVGRDSTGWAIETDSGRVRWQIGGTPSVTAFGGGAGPAVTGDLVVFPFPSGELVGVFPQGGLQRWSTVVSGTRVGTAGVVSDIGADPVISNGVVYAGNVSGRTVAVDSFSGQRLWTAPEGAVGPLWPSGGSVFLVNDRAQLVRLDAATGDLIWRTQLPEAVTTGTLRKRRNFFAHYGPVLAGGRLLVASSDGQLRAFDPRNGALVGNAAIPGGAAAQPAVAGGTLYVVTKSGQLVAFR